MAADELSGRNDRCSGARCSWPPVAVSAVVRPSRGVRALVSASVVAAALVAAPGAAAHAAPAGDAASAAAEQQVRDQLEASHVPAASYAVVDDGQVRAGGWGPGVDEHTPFVIGSITKTFTALAVVQLVDRGMVELDAPVTRYLPDFRTADPAAVITVRQLLAQTSGLPTRAGLDLLEDPQLSLRERVAGAADVELVSHPGEAFHYCNLNYAVLGRLVEQVSGRSFGDHVAREVLAPLGMTHSHVRHVDAVADGMPDGSLVWFGATVRQDARWSDSALPDGQLVSTAQDMAGYLRFQLGDGTWQGRRIVSEAGLRSMHHPAVATPPDAAAESTTHYGLGWGVGSIGGQDLVAHSGDETGYHADAALLPDSERAIVVLTARNGFLTDPSSAYRAGVHALVGLPAADPSTAFVWTYAVVDAVALLAVTAMALSLWRRRRWAASLPGKAARRGRWGALAPTVVLDVLLAVGLYLGVFVGIGTLLLGFPFTVPVLLSSTPDLLCLVLAGVASSVVKAVLDLRLGLTALRRAAGRSPQRVPTPHPATRRSPP